MIAKIQRMGYCYFNNSEPYQLSIRPATPRTMSFSQTEIWHRTAHPGGFLLFKGCFAATCGGNRL